ncbi:hypothetical protein NMY22_g14310 [Coprinellus aureogranulatus]|nr:hypothetical protein NMY22_g14310 [Coprinellus aureogranulatus]
MFCRRRPTKRAVARPYSPITMLCEDILRTVFDYTLPSDPTEIVIHPSQPPLSLVNVCHDWRALVFTQPDLWKFIRIVDDLNTPPSNSDARYTLFRRCIELSMTRPLKLQLEVLPRSGMGLQGVAANGSLDFCIGFMKKSLLSSPLMNSALLPSSGRITNLTLNRLPLFPIHKLPEGHFPVLESLSLSFAEEELKAFKWTARGPIVAFATYPSRLRRVALGNCGFRYNNRPNFYTVALPFPQITHIIDTDTRDDVGSEFLMHGYLRDFPNLKFLFVPQTPADRLNMLARGIPAAPLLSARSLEHLTLESTSARGDGDEWMLIFASFEMPRLRTLRLTCKMLSLWMLGHVLMVLPMLEKLDVSVEEGSVDGLLQMMTLPIVKQDDSSPMRWFHSCYRTFIHQPIDTSVLSRFLRSRRFCPPAHRLHALVVCTSKPKIVRNKYPFIKVAHAWLKTDDEGMGLKFERDVTDLEEDDEGKDDAWNMRWMERDPELQDWREVFGFLNSNMKT